MITKKLFLKAQNILVIRVEETSKKVNVDIVYCDRAGRHEHTVSWNKSMLPTIENARDILWCDCVYCSSYNINTKYLCALKIRAIKEFVIRKYWSREIWDALIASVDLNV